MNTNRRGFLAALAALVAAPLAPSTYPVGARTDYRTITDIDYENRVVTYDGASFDSISAASIKRHYPKGVVGTFLSYHRPIWEPR
jgi:hypothetical protein